MTGIVRMLSRYSCLILLLMGTTAVCQDVAEEFAQSSGWYIQGGAYIHYNEEDDYEGPPLFAGIEYFRSRRWLLGFSMFQNSFGQFTQYAYVGRVFHPWESQPNLHIKLTGGLVQGYRGKHHNTLPIRWSESWGLGFVPTIGLRRERFGFDVALLQDSGLLFLGGYRFR